MNQIMARLPFTRQKLHIDDTGTMYVIDTPGGISIQWYHSTGIMVLQYTKPDNTSTRGLCGQCVSQHWVSVINNINKSPLYSLLFIVYYSLSRLFKRLFSSPDIMYSVVFKLHERMNALLACVAMFQY